MENVSTNPGFSKSNGNALNEIQIEEETLHDDSTEYTISDLADQINNVDENETSIEGTFVYDDEKDQEYRNGLQINKNQSFTINGNNNLIIEGNLIFNASNLTFTRTTFNNCILSNLNGSILEFNECKFDNSYLINKQNVRFYQCDISKSNITNYGSVDSEGWRMNPNRYPITNSNITNYGNISFLSQLISRNNLSNWANVTSSRSYMENNNIENNGGIINLTTWVNHNNITNNAGALNLIKVNFVLNGLVNYASINFINEDGFLSDEYVESNTIVNLNGIIAFDSGFFSANNITNYDEITFTKVDSTEDNLTNYGNVQYLATKNNYYEGFSNYLNREHIINYGNLTIQSGKISDLVLNNSGMINITNKSSLNNTNLTNERGEISFNASALNNATILNSKGSINLNNISMNGGSLTNKGTLNIAGNMTSFSNNPKMTNYGDMKIAGDVKQSGLVIDKIDAIASATKISMYYGATKYITIKAVDSDGNPIKNTKFTITINKKQVTTTSDAQGIAKVKIPALNVGLYIATIKGDTPYYNIASETTVTVNMAKTTVKVAKTVKKSKKLKGKNIQTQNQQKRSCKTQNQQNNKRKTQTGHHFIEQKLQNKQKN